MLADQMDIWFWSQGWLSMASFVHQGRDGLVQNEGISEAVEIVKWLKKRWDSGADENKLCWQWEVRGEWKRYEVKLVHWPEKVWEDENKDSIEMVDEVSWLCALVFQGLLAIKI